jgi:SAM-dependent methyltransferase
MRGALCPPGRSRVAWLGAASDHAQPTLMDGSRGWDEYAAFYDWENAHTVGRRDVRFWRDFALRAGGPALELGCGTGRVILPLARAGVPIVGVDRSARMLSFARRRLRRAKLLRPRSEAARHSGMAAPDGHRASVDGDLTTSGASLVRGDIRFLPFVPEAFGAVIAPYGILQSLLSDRAVKATLDAVARVVSRGGRFGIDLVPDVPRWKEYRGRVSLVGRRGRSGPLITLVESVRQDRARRLTIFDHEYIVGWGRRREVRQFTVTFRTLPVASIVRRLERAGFAVDATLGGYDGRPLDSESDAWLILATRR